MTVRVDFPALDAYVAYLRDHDDTQRKLDLITTQLAALRVRLLQSSTALLSASKSASKE